MKVILEPISTENTAEEIALTNADDPPPPAPSALPPKPEHDVPVKRPRGRPKGKAAPKVPAPRKAAPARAKRPPSPSSDSSADGAAQSASSDSEPRRPRGTSAAVRNLMQDDIETQVLQFLTAKKASQHQKRNALWKQLASSGLHR